MEEGAGRNREAGERTVNTYTAQRTRGDGVGGKGATLGTEEGVVGTGKVEGVLWGKKVISSTHTTNSTSLTGSLTGCCYPAVDKRLPYQSKSPHPPNPTLP